MGDSDSFEWCGERSTAGNLNDDKKVLISVGMLRGAHTQALHDNNGLNVHGTIVFP